MYRLTEVVKNLLIINGIVFFAINYLPFLQPYRPLFYLFHPSDPAFSPIQIVTHMFNHGNESHLLMNLMGLFFLGPTVENALGPKRFLVLYILAGLGAAALHFMLSGAPIVGASGAILGVVAAFAIMFPNVELMIIFIPIPIKAKYLITFFLVVDLVLGLTNSSTGIAHFAHLGGALVGAIMVFVYRKNPTLLR